MSDQKDTSASVVSEIDAQIVEEERRVPSIIEAEPEKQIQTINDDFILACKDGNIERVNELIGADGVLINYVDKATNKNTPLHWAVKSNKLDLVKALLVAGADPNARNKNKKTALHQAVDLNAAEIAKLLIENGADINAVNRWKNTPLHDAAYMGQKEFAAALLTAGANTKLLNSNKDTPLHLAAIYGHKDVVQVLLASGANVHIVNGHKQTPLHQAANREIAKLLLNAGADVDALDKDKETPLHYEARKGRVDMVQLLLNAGADIYLVNKDEYAPFDVAESKEIRDMIQNSDKLKTHAVVVAHGAHSVSESNGGFDQEMSVILTEAEIALKNEMKPLNEELLALVKEGTNLDRISELLKTENVNINYQDGGRDKNTPIHWAAKKNHVEVAKLLVKSGANIHLRNRNKKTPLHCAVEFNAVEIVKLLIDSGVDVNHVNRWKQSALHEAATRGFVEIVQLLLADNAKLDLTTNNRDTALHLAAGNGYPAIVKLLLEAGALVNIVNESKQTPLHIAADLEIVNLLVEGGIDLDIQDKNGETALHYEARKGRIPIVLLLLSAGADIYLVNKNEFAAFDLAENKDVMELIKTAGVKFGSKVVREIQPVPEDMERLRSSSLEVVDVDTLAAANASLLRQVNDLHNKLENQQVKLDQSDSDLLFANTQLKKVLALHEKLIGNLAIVPENKSLIIARLEKYLSQSAETLEADAVSLSELETAVQRASARRTALETENKGEATAPPRRFSLTGGEKKCVIC